MKSMRKYCTTLKKPNVMAEYRTAMPYVIRDPGGKIIGLSEDEGAGAVERLELSDPEVLEYLMGTKNQLLSSDADTIRVIEDLVDVLIQKKLILLTDLPPAAQQKLILRQRMRNELTVLDNLMVDETDIL